VAWSAPLGTSTGWLVYIPGYVPKPDEPGTTPWVDGISPGYFKTMGIPIMLGRDFDDRDVASKASVMIVNETFARHYFGGENAVGILAMVLREAATMFAFGVGAGIAAAWGLGRIVSNLLYGVQPSDLASMAIAVGVLAAAGTLAAWIPARRASRTDPIQALRYE
jgi:hypothetical protein